MGGTSPIKTNVRIISATNRDLERFVEEGKFRRDLYYRLNVVPIRIPSLSERVDDIPALVKHFLAKYGKNSASQEASQTARWNTCSSSPGPATSENSKTRYSA